jgi:hypothetical protein
MDILLHEHQKTARDPKAMQQLVIIDLEPADPPGDGTICGISPGNGPSHAFVHGGIIWLRSQASYQLTFELPTNPAPSFKFDTGDPIWSSQAQCPTSACQDGQISNPVVDPSGMSLTIDVTPNGTNAVHISLGWDNGKRFDPIVINN